MASSKFLKFQNGAMLLKDLGMTLCCCGQADKPFCDNGCWYLNCLQYSDFATCRFPNTLLGNSISFDLNGSYSSVSNRLVGAYYEHLEYDMTLSFNGTLDILDTDYGKFNPNHGYRVYAHWDGDILCTAYLRPNFNFSMNGNGVGGFAGDPWNWSWSGGNLEWIAYADDSFGYDDFLIRFILNRMCLSDEVGWATKLLNLTNTYHFNVDPSGLDHKTNFFGLSPISDYYCQSYASGTRFCDSNYLYHRYMNSSKTIDNSQCSFTTDFDYYDKSYVEYRTGGSGSIYESGCYPQTLISSTSLTVTSVNNGGCY